MDIQREIDNILKDKDILPPHMTESEYLEEFSRRFHQEIGDVVQKTSSRIAMDIADEEMAKCGRAVPCRHLLHATRKLCNKMARCITCPNYQPLTWWQRWLTKKEIAVMMLFVVFTISFISGLLFPEMTYPVMGSLFVAFSITFWTNYQLRKKLNKQ